MTPQQHVFVGNTVRLYFFYLKDDDIIEFSFVENEMIWSAL